MPHNDRIRADVTGRQRILTVSRCCTVNSDWEHFIDVASPQAHESTANLAGKPESCMFLVLDMVGETSVCSHSFYPLSNDLQDQQTVGGRVMTSLLHFDKSEY